MDTLLRDVRYALRTLGRNPAYAAAAVAALALGIGANSAIFSVVNAVLLRPLPYPDAASLVQVYENDRLRGLHKDSVTPADFIDWRQQSTSFTGLAAFDRTGLDLRGPEAPVRIRGAVVSAEFFDVLGVRPVVGRGFGAADAGGERVIVLSEALWRRQFGADAGIAGRRLTINGEPFTVTGVMPAGFAFPERAEAWALAKNVVPENAFLSPSQDISQVRGMHYFNVVGRLRPGVTRAEAQTEMDGIAARLEKAYPDTNSGVGVEIYALREALVGDMRPALLAFAAAVGLVLLIACANVANLMLARSAARQREIAVRTALGAGRGRLVRQLLTEAVVLSLIGGAGGVLLALWGTDALVALAGEPMAAAQTGVDARVLLFTLALSLATGVVFGLAPALHCLSGDVHDALKEGGRSTAGRRARVLRHALIVSEMGLALVLLSGAGLLVKSFLRLQAVETGVDPRGVLTAYVTIPATRYPEGEQATAFYARLLERAAALPGVEVAGGATDLPMGGNDSNLGFTIEGRPAPPPGERDSAGFHQVTPGFFAALGIPILAGRGFTDADAPASVPVAVISETMARRHWPGEDPIGRRLSFGTDDRGAPTWTTIVGVAADVRNLAPGLPLRAETYVPLSQNPARYLSLVLRAAVDPATLTPALRREVTAVDPDVPLTYVMTMEEVIASSIASSRFNAVLLALFACAAVTLAAVGLYGVMAYSVAQRTHEIGVRMALGARRGDVLRLVLGQGMTLALGGVLFGAAGAFAMRPLLGSLLFEVAPGDPATFACVALTLAAVALVACWVPARRAARVDPMVALRCE